MEQGGSLLLQLVCSTFRQQKRVMITIVLVINRVISIACPEGRKGYALCMHAAVHWFWAFLNGESAFSGSLRSLERLMPEEGLGPAATSDLGTCAGEVVMASLHAATKLQDLLLSSSAFGFGTGDGACTPKNVLFYMYRSGAYRIQPNLKLTRQQRLQRSPHPACVLHLQFRL